MDLRYERAAAALGGSPWYVMRRVTLPMIAPQLAAGAVLTWARALGEFGATITFAGQPRGAHANAPARRLPGAGDGPGRRGPAVAHPGGALARRARRPPRQARGSPRKVRAHAAGRRGHGAPRHVRRRGRVLCRGRRDRRAPRPERGRARAPSSRRSPGSTPLEAGHVRVDGVAIDALPPERRPIGIAFQDALLFPHLSVLENVAFPLRARGRAEPTRRGPTRSRSSAIWRRAFGPTRSRRTCRGASASASRSPGRS